ncbi:MAG TPA: hypothetical protein VMU89_08005 [Thermomicrobiaceae bacterium]|nr:hypothetical protein [Thermomicrobiaceae bacterium]
MYAIVRENTYDSTGLAQGQEQLTAFQELHARQAGYRGTLVVDAGDGRWLAVNLWETEEHARAALPGLVPEVQRLLEPMMAGPSRLIGTGRVALTDLTRA